MRAPFILLMIVALSACKKYLTPDEMRLKSEREIVGTWLLDKRTDEFFDYSYRGDSLRSTYTYLGKKDDYYSFQEGGVLFYSLATDTFPMLTKLEYTVPFFNSVFIAPDSFKYYDLDIQGNHMVISTWQNNPETFTGNRVTIHLIKEGH